LFFAKKAYIGESAYFYFKVLWGDFLNAHEVIAFAKKNDLKLVDLKFTDLPGTWQHFTVPLNQIDEQSFEAGLGFDGSSIRGFQDIHESDMLVLPDPSTGIVDPFASHCLSLVCDIKDPIKKQIYSRDPRFIARKAEQFLSASKIAERAYFGPEAEFFIFDSIRFGQNEYSGYYHIDSNEGIWNSGLQNGENNLGHRPRHKEGYFPVSPADSLQEIRSEIILTMMNAGITVEAHHHEVATAGQCEIDIKYDTAVKTGDNIMLYKYIVKNIARKHGKTATFMPKPLFNDNGSGMHVHQSLWSNGTNLFVGDKYAGLSETAIHYIGGILKHAPSLAAFVAPTTNSYRRLVPGFEAPVNLVYSSRNRSAAVRIPAYHESPKAKRIEFRCPDPSANPYLAFAAMLMAGLDGVRKKTEPPAPLDDNIYNLSKEKAAQIKSMPGSLEESLDELKRDHQFMLEGDVFTKDVIDVWIEMKHSKEIPEISRRPHPWEYHMYFDV